MKILVTGATGYLGHRLALALAERNNQVHILVRNPNSRNIPQHKNIRVFVGDITNRQSITLAMKGCQQVYHTAAKVGLCIEEYDDFYIVNVEGTRNMLEAIVQLGVDKAVFTSTCGVVGPSLGEPLNETSPRMNDINNAYDSTKKKK